MVFWYNKLHDLKTSDFYSYPESIIIAKDEFAFKKDNKDVYIKNYAIFKTYQDVLDYIKLSKYKYFHEIILENDKQYMKFDIDLTFNEFETIKQYVKYNDCNKFVKDLMFNITSIIQHIYGHFKNGIMFPDMSVCESNTSKKISYHMVFKDLIFNSNKATKWIYNCVIGILLKDDTFKNIPESKLTSIIDKAVYKNVQGLRIVGCNKPNKDNCKKVIKGELLDTFIGAKNCILGITLDDIYEILNIEEIKPCKFNTFDVSELKEDKLTDLVMLCEAEHYNDWFKVGIILFNIFYENGAEEEDKYLSIYHNYSNKSNKYNKDDTDQMWSNFKYKSSKPLNFGSLCLLAKQNNIDEFIKWQHKYKKRTNDIIYSIDNDISNDEKDIIDFVRLNIDRSDEGLADIFVRCNNNIKIVSGKGKCYAFNEHRKLWLEKDNLYVEYKYLKP